MLAIAGGKGGVGKTTSALGLAATLPGRPLVVDADRDMPDLHALAAVPRAESTNTTDVIDRTRYSDAYDCRVLPAPTDDTVATEEWLIRIRSGWSAGGSNKSSTARTSPVTLIDTPAGAGINAAVPLRVADGVVLVSTACAPALRDAAKTASMARAVGTPVVGAILVRTSARPPNASDLFGCPLLAVVPESTGRPLTDRRVRDRYDAAATALEGAVERV
ncbi:MinD/ParA family ATP-binding protein [Halolamina salifodinae]|uniref:Septum site-determining protein MinD n=1 Tax=Halolamina salifodinae TaxID=1202767 RepID=A0A8T4GY49_9EURY|nr:CDP-4-keto-6-deoxy-D-glucose-3-dehydrase [Halolamina salifodinae]MBP1986474.1 septum site-determining protein MinD [Halolamina salifodinae]